MTTSDPTVKTAAQLDAMAASGRLLATTLTYLTGVVEPGMTTRQLDRLAEAFIREHGATPSFLGYGGFPGSVCTSVNAQVVHGVPTDVPLADGDSLKLDCGVQLDGWHADSAVTLVVGDPSAVAPGLDRVVDACRAAMWAGIDAAVVGAHVGDIGAAIGAVADRYGVTVAEGFTGHGIGTALHEQPAVPNRGQPGDGTQLAAGMVLAIEPIFVVGSGKMVTLDDKWTVQPADGHLCAHFEHTVAVTADGPRVLTLRDDEQRP